MRSRTARRFAGLALAAALSAAGGAPAAAGGDAPPAPAPSIEDAAKAALEAWRAKDEPRLRALAAATQADAFHVAQRLFSQHVRGSFGEPGETPFEAVEAFAEAADATRMGRGVKAVVATWRGYTAEDLAREYRLLALRRKTFDANKRRAWAETVGLAEESKADLAAARSSLVALAIRVETARARDGLGRGDEAYAGLAAAAGEAARLGWTTTEGNLWIEATEVAFRARDAARAVASTRGTLDAWERLGEAKAIPATRLNYAHCLFLAGRLDEARDQARRSAQEAEATGQPDVVAAAFTTLLSVERARGDLPAALAVGARAVEAQVARGDVAGAAAALVELGTAAGAADRVGEAIGFFERAREAAVASGNQEFVAAALGGLGSLYRRIGKLDQALAAHRAAVEAASASGKPALLTAIQGNLAAVLTNLGRDAEAVDLLRSALEAKLARGDRRGVAETRVNLTIALRHLGRGDEAMTEAAAALEEFRALGLRSLEALAEGNVALLHGDRGRHEEAYRHHRASVALFEALGDRTLSVARAWTNLARTEVLLGKPTDAIESARRSLAIHAALARGLGEEDALGMRIAARAAADVGVEAAAGLPAAEASRAGEAAEVAFGFAEAGRGLVLAEGIVNAAALLAAGTPPDLLAAEARTRADVEATRRAAVAAAAKGGDPAASSARVAAAWTAREAAVSRIQREARRAADVVFPRPVDLASFRAHLPAGTAFVLYQTSAARVRAVVVTAKAASLVDLGVAEATLKDAEAYVRVASTPDGPEEALAARLYDALVRPIEAGIGDARRLLVCPDGALAFLPFAALLRRESGRGERLCERFVIAFTPSATVYEALRSEAPKGAAAGKGVVVVGDPVYLGEKGGDARYARLEGSGEEAREVAALFAAEHPTVLVRGDATLARLTEALAAGGGSPRRAIHLACHAFVDPERPLLSGLALAQDEVLDVDRIYRMRIPSDLVVLSACESARGGLAQGEGVLGFVRGFFYAGAARVVASTWRVPDLGTRALMSRFYEHLAREGLDPASALRAAQVDRIRGGGEGAHPYTWAGFSLWGLAD